VLFLEIVLGYQHRGVERLLETLPREGAMLVAESIAGDTVIGHAETFCGAMEALGRCQKSVHSQSVRGIGLELERRHYERIYRAARAIAFPRGGVLGRMRGDCPNLLLELSGNRLTRWRGPAASDSTHPRRRSSSRGWKT
jgi:Ni,Fe-hydrogenase III large subunit